MQKPSQSPEHEKGPEQQPLSLMALSDKEIVALGRVIVGALTGEDEDDIGYELASILLRFRAGLTELLQHDAPRGLNLICRAASSDHDLERTLAAECLTTLSEYNFELAVRLAVQMGADERVDHECSSEVALMALGEIELGASSERAVYIRSVEQAVNPRWA
jgi:hypothetical protein